MSLDILVSLMNKIDKQRKESFNEDITIYDNFNKMYFFDNQRLRKIINESNAGKITLKLQDIEFMIDRMQKIIKKIEDNANLFLESQNDFIIDDITELSYLFSSYAFSIVNTYRAIFENYKVEGYDKKRKEIFDNGLHNIVHDILRNSTVHGKLYKTSWNIHYSIEPYSKNIFITFDKNVILENEKNKLNSKGKEYLLKCDKYVDVIQLFKDYIECVVLLYTWFADTIKKQYENDFNLYIKYINWINELEQKTADGLKKQMEKN